MLRSSVKFFIFLIGIAAVLSDGTEPTFKYVTSYNEAGRFMTKDDIGKSSVNVLKPIIFIIGGLTNVDKKGDSWSSDLQSAYLEKLIHNVFIVDWDLPSPPSIASINKAHSAGSTLADFIATLFNKTGEAYLNIHLVGVSLGGEVAASAADRLRELSGRKINRITGLDPSYYLISDEGDSNRLLFEKSADFVDAVHADLDDADEEPPQTGHLDFYVDGGNNGTSNDGTPKSVALFAKSVSSNDIKATKCDGLLKFRSGVCNEEDQVTFGENVDTRATGKYFLKY